MMAEDADHINPTNGVVTRRYEIQIYEEDLDHQFTAEEKAILRPIAEIIAILDGNAFFGMDLLDGKEWYEQYLPEAKSIFDATGGYNGAIMNTSWVLEMNPTNPAVREAYHAYKTIKGLGQE
jgi:hypothetical protein